MGCDIFANVAHGGDQEDMEFTMTSEVGWTNPRGFIGDTWGVWYNYWDDMTGLNTNREFGVVDALRVHKALIKAMQWMKSQTSPPPECFKLIRWLEICCEYDATLSFFQ